MRSTFQQGTFWLIFLTCISIIDLYIYSYIRNIYFDYFQDENKFLNVRKSLITAREQYKDTISLSDIDKLAEDFSGNQSLHKPVQPVGEKIVFLVPYRDRKQDLLAFLLHMTAYLRIKGTNYEIVVIEQSKAGRFNRAKLFNAALREIFNTKSGDRLYQSTCFAFHDVDKIPISLKTPYQCAYRPIQILRYVHYKKGGRR